MKFLETLITILQVISAALVMILVLLQEGNEGGNIITSESNKGGVMGFSKEAKLAKITKYTGIVFVVLTIAATSLMIINY